MTLQTSDLKQFTGTEQYYRHWLGYVYTDGVKYVAETAQAHWLLDVIFSYRRKEPFQVWELKVNEDKTAVVTMREDSNKPVKVKQEFDFTDFPLENIKFYLIDKVLLLTSEY